MRLAHGEIALISHHWPLYGTELSVGERLVIHWRSHGSLERFAIFTVLPAWFIYGMMTVGLQMSATENVMWSHCSRLSAVPRVIWCWCRRDGFAPFVTSFCHSCIYYAHKFSCWVPLPLCHNVHSGCLSCSPVNLHENCPGHRLRWPVMNLAAGERVLLSASDTKRTLSSRKCR